MAFSTNLAACHESEGNGGVLKGIARVVVAHRGEMRKMKKCQKK